MKRLKLLFLFLTLVLLNYAQVPPEAEDEKVEFAEEISKEFSVPAIPALDFISSDPGDISRPSNVKKLAAGIYNGIDEDGKVKQGLALEAKVAEYIPMNISPEEYRNNQLKYIFYNTQVSLGTMATSGDSSSTDLGWGVRLTIFDDSDPMRNKAYLNEFEEALFECGKPIDPFTPVHPDSMMKCLENYDRPIKKAFNKERWNAKWMTLAYAGGTRLKGSQISEGEVLGHQVWLTGGFPISYWGQWSYLTKWSEEFNSETAQNMQELEVGTKLLVGSKSFNIYFEASYNPLLNKDDFKSNEMVATEKSFSWVSGVEFKVSEGVWAVTGLGEEANRISGKEGIQLLSGIRMGISDKSRLKN